MKRTIALLLCLCLCLAACGKEPVATQPSTETTTEPTTEATTAPTTEATTEPTTEPTTIPTTEPPVLYRHPLNGQLLEEPFTVRPIAISTNNYRDAQPVLGTMHADIVFEHITEGYGTQTRMLAIHSDLNHDDRLGSIRSARTYSVDIASGFKAIFVHCGGSDFALDQIRKTKYPSFDQFYNGDYFYRDQSRRAAGIENEHCLVTEGNLLMSGIKTKNWNLTTPEGMYYGFTFDDVIDLDGEKANSITLQFYDSKGKTTTMTYDKEDGVYYGTQTWYKKQGTIGDGNTGESIPFKNVLILKTKVFGAGDGLHVFMETTGTGEGYYACNGEYVPITWSRKTANDPYTFTMADGTEVVFGVGKTYVAILPTVSPAVIFE